MGFALTFPIPFGSWYGGYLSSVCCCRFPPFRLPPCLCALSLCRSACHCVNLKGWFFGGGGFPLLLLHPLLKRQLASKTPGYLLSNTFSHKDFSLYKYIYTRGPLLKMWFTRKGRGRRQEGEDKIIKGYHEEKFTLVAFHLLLTCVEWNRKNVVSTSRYTIRIYKGDMVRFIYYKTDL